MSHESTASAAIVVDKTARPAPRLSTRSDLPGPPVARGSVSLWSVLKSVIGKDLARIALPIGLNEPISFLQRLAEYMEYSELLVKAAASTDPKDRIELIAAFAASTLSNVRMTKPFNPLLHETYELNNSDLGFKFVAEQVSHHPPVSAFHAQADSFVFSGTVAPRVKFWGRSVECDPGCFFTLKLNTTNGVETYTWNAVSCSVYNIVMGTMYLCLGGHLIIKSHSTPYEVRINFKGSGKKGADLFVEGETMFKGKKLNKLYGNWRHFLASHNYDTYAAHANNFEKEFRKHCDSNSEDCPLVMFRRSRLLWNAARRPATFDQFYSFTYFTLTLNEMPAQHNLPSTDCRFRPDLRLFENGELDKAAQEKERLEDKQRAARKKNKKPEIARWFKYIGKDEFGRDGQWEFEGSYWSRTGDETLEDIF